MKIEEILAKAIAANHDRENEDNHAKRRSRPLSFDVVVERLKELVVAYSPECPFKVGQLVTPRADGALKGAGEPHIVVEIADDFERFSNKESPSYMSHGYRPTVRTISYSINDLTYTAFWNEHGEFREWTDEDTRLYIERNG